MNIILIGQYSLSIKLCSHIIHSYCPFGCQDYEIYNETITDITESCCTVVINFKLYIFLKWFTDNDHWISLLSEGVWRSLHAKNGSQTVPDSHRLKPNIWWLLPDVKVKASSPFPWRAWSQKPLSNIRYGDWCQYT